MYGILVFLCCSFVCNFIHLVVCVREYFGIWSFSRQVSVRLSFCFCVGRKCVLALIPCVPIQYVKFKIFYIHFPYFAIIISIFLYSLLEGISICMYIYVCYSPNYYTAKKLPKTQHMFGGKFVLYYSFKLFANSVPFVPGELVAICDQIKRSNYVTLPVHLNSFRKDTFAVFCHKLAILV